MKKSKQKANNSKQKTNKQKYYADLFVCFFLFSGNLQKSPKNKSSDISRFPEISRNFRKISGDFQFLFWKLLEIAGNYKLLFLEISVICSDLFLFRLIWKCPKNMWKNLQIFRKFPGFSGDFPKIFWNVLEFSRKF